MSKTKIISGVAALVLTTALVSALLSAGCKSGGEDPTLNAAPPVAADAKPAGTAPNKNRPAAAAAAPTGEAGGSAPTTKP